MFCKICYDSGKPKSKYTSHWVKEGGKVVCETLLNHVCSICHRTGHTPNYCPQKYRSGHRRCNGGCGKLPAMHQKRMRLLCTDDQYAELMCARENAAPKIKYVKADLIPNKRKIADTTDHKEFAPNNCYDTFA
jgi:hypothetical protein